MKKEFDKIKTGKTIFIVIHQAFGARYLLRSELFRRLKESVKRLVIITPNADEEYFVKEFRGDNVFVEMFEVEKCREYLKTSRAQKFFKLIRWFVLNGKYDIKSVDDHYRIFLKEFPDNNPAAKIKLFAIRIIVKILRKSKMMRDLLIWTESVLFRPDIHKSLFVKYEPDMVITTSLGNVGDGFDSIIMREARKNGVKVATVILSWDNTSGKGLGGAKADLVITWTDIMKKELMEYHDYPEERIEVGGIAHFDIYHHRERFISKKEIFKKFGLSEDRKLILFGTKSPVSYPWNAYIVEKIARAVEDGRLICPCQLMVRVHPLHYSMKNGVRRHQRTLDEYERLRNKYQNVFFNFPAVYPGKLGYDMPSSEMIDLASILDCTDILINIYSTLTLEAAILDVPVVNVSFEGDKKGATARQSVKVDEEQVHNQRVVRTGGVRLAYSQDELVKYINMYLENPSLDRDNRKKIVERECGPHPGTACDRITRLISSPPLK